MTDYTVEIEYTTCDGMNVYVEDFVEAGVFSTLEEAIDFADAINPDEYMREEYEGFDITIIETDEDGDLLPEQNNYIREIR